SGGHTELILMREHGDYQKLGATVDDAAGECFDKVAKLLDLPYPGGPQISKLAETGKINAIKFPRPMLAHENYAFSFAGLKTSALYWLRDNKLTAVKLGSITLPAGILGQQSEPPTMSDFCASFEEAIVEVLVKKTLRAAKEFNPKTIILAGGVAANKKLRETLQKEIVNQSLNSAFLIPDTKYCMDNAAMIAVAGYYKAQKNQYTDWRDLKADPNWEIN
ncbi:MAG: tRNA (adenosine(37)-N6)-threonylcarbamoyltransferase complex transferase subunit TsaD, partial [Candidatus Magasanikbacteria bacterium]